METQTSTKAVSARAPSSNVSEKAPSRVPSKVHNTDNIDDLAEHEEDQTRGVGVEPERVPVREAGVQKSPKSPALPSSQLESPSRSGSSSDPGPDPRKTDKGTQLGISREQKSQQTKHARVDRTKAKSPRAKPAMESVGVQGSPRADVRDAGVQLSLPASSSFDGQLSTVKSST